MCVISLTKAAASPPPPLLQPPSHPHPSLPSSFFPLLLIVNLQPCTADQAGASGRLKVADDLEQKRGHRTQAAFRCCVISCCRKLRGSCSTDATQDMTGRTRKDRADTLAKHSDVQPQVFVRLQLFTLTDAYFQHHLSFGEPFDWFLILFSHMCNIYFLFKNLCFSHNEG